MYVIKDMLGDKALMQTGLGQLKAAFATFAANEQKFPLVHESERSPSLCRSPAIDANMMLCSGLGWHCIVSKLCYWKLWRRLWEHVLQ